MTIPSQMLRGGSWYYNPWCCRSAYRSHYLPDCAIDLIGFRVVVSSHSPSISPLPLS